MPVAALYVDLSRGPYPRIEGVDCWGRSSRDGGQLGLFSRDRDARRYRGPAPAIAHPPCGPWGKFKWNYKGGEGDAGSGIRAVAQVREYGGVLEHPCGSSLWAAAGLPRPRGGRDRYGGWTLEVNQCDWGHPAKKPTWLYIVGNDTPPPRPPPGTPTHVMVRLLSNGNNLPELPRRFRHITPPLFAAWLVELALSPPKNLTKEN